MNIKDHIFDGIITARFLGTSQTFERGSTIFFPGDPATRVYLLFAGAVKLSQMDESGTETTIALLPPNSLFGLLPLIDGHHQGQLYHAVTWTKVELLSIPITELKSGLGKSPELSRLIVLLLSQRLIRTEKMVEIWLGRNLLTRLVYLLLMLSSNFGIQTESGVKIDLKLTHQALAELIGSSRVSITRLLGVLQRKGMISLRSQQITVHKVRVLSQQFDWEYPIR